MPLFGPSIEKMKEKRDIDGLVRALSDTKVRSEAIKALVELKSIEGLIKALNSDNAEVRIEVAETLKEIGDPFALEVLIEALTTALIYGEIEDQIEAITLIQGRAPEEILEVVFADDPYRVKFLKQVKRKLSHETLRNALFAIVNSQESAGIVVWYALLALIELGEYNDEVLNFFIEFTNKYLTMLEQVDESMRIAALRIGLAVHEETMRALSQFKGSKKAVDAIIKAYKGEFLRRPFTSSEGRSKDAIYALIALGDPSAKTFLEYLVARGSVPKIALDLYGKATYDEIKAKLASIWKK
jgi:16S rRNA G966 N2-methylase RsmD